MCILRGMIGAPRSLDATPRGGSLARLSLLLVVAACAGGDTGISASGNPFTTQPGNTTPPVGETFDDPTVGGETTLPTGGSEGLTGGPATDPTDTADPTVPDPDCVDADGDLHGENCDAGPDCDDTKYNAHTMCDTCVDVDGDNYWVGCDQYGQDAPGPDCDDADPDKFDGMECTCAETPETQASESCAEAAVGSLGALAEGGVVPPIKGAISGVDNGIGNGNEDWYWVEFPEAMAMGARPNAGKPTIAFAVNPGDPANPDYRFELYATCGGEPFAGLASNFGMNAPPATEWTFFDEHKPPNPNPNPNPNYSNTTPWPAKVYIRVFRAQNDQSCSEYTLQVSRTPN